MAASTVLSRFSSRLRPLALKLNKSATTSPLRSSSQSLFPAQAKRVLGISRLPLELSSMGSMMPLHSAIASSRLQSKLSIESQSWGLISQGISMPL